MGRFQFRLESLLRLREAEREQRRIELAEAFNAETVLQDQTDQIMQHIHEMTLRARVCCSPGTVDIDALLDAQRFRAILDSQATVLQQKSRQLGQEIQRRREALVEADRQVRMLEKLRERKRDEYQAAELREEMKQLDEIAVQQFARTKEALR